MSTLVRLDQTSGYQWVDFYVDQSCHWPETVSWDAAGVSTGGFGETDFGIGPFGEDPGGSINVSGYTARLVVIRAGFDATPVLDLVSPTDITINGTAGTFSWDVPAGLMAALTHPVYQHELTLFPGANSSRAIALIKGRVLVRASLASLLAPPPGETFGFGSGPYGSGPYGGS